MMAEKGSSCQNFKSSNEDENVDDALKENKPETSISAAGVSAVSSTSKKKYRTTGFRRKSRTKPKDVSIQKRKKLASWSLSKLNCNFKRVPDVDIAEPSVECSSCVCTGYRRTEDHHLGAGIVFKSSDNQSLRPTCDFPEAEPVIDLSKFNPEDYPIEDCDERARRERAREIEEGVDPPPGYNPSQTKGADDKFAAEISTSLQQVTITPVSSEQEAPIYFISELPEVSMISQNSAPNIFATFHDLNRLNNQPTVLDRNCIQYPIHTQVDYIHCLVPDILDITNCSFYWGKMDQYKAERLLENKPEGTFLLRDSAQEDYLFSVSFRRYGRSLHARIEQWNHKFSFDAHDPGVFASSSVCGLIEHYKDPSRCMFFEPMLTIPLHRSCTFSLQHLCRSTISDKISYDGVSKLPLPKSLKAYLKEYHYKQRVRVRLFDIEH